MRSALSDGKSRKDTEEFRARVHCKWHDYYFDVREDMLRELKGPGRTVRRFYDRCCERRHVPGDDRDDLLKRLHRLGELLHYGDASARKLQDTIYEVEWINRAIYDLLFLKDIGEPMSAAVVKARVEAQPARANPEFLSVEVWEHVLLMLQQFEGCWVVPDETGRRRFVIPAACPKMPGSVSRHWEGDWAQAARIECGFETDRLLHRLVARLANCVSEVESYRDGAILSIVGGGEAGLRVGASDESIRIAVRGSPTLRDLIRFQLYQLWPQIGLSVEKLPHEWQAATDRDQRGDGVAVLRGALTPDWIYSAKIIKEIENALREKPGTAAANTFLAYLGEGRQRSERLNELVKDTIEPRLTLDQRGKFRAPAAPEGKPKRKRTRAKKTDRENKRLRLDRHVLRDVLMNHPTALNAIQKTSGSELHRDWSIINRVEDPRYCCPRCGALNQPRLDHGIPRPEKCVACAEEFCDEDKPDKCPPDTLICMRGGEPIEFSRREPQRGWMNESRRDGKCPALRCKERPHVLE